MTKCIIIGEQPQEKKLKPIEFVFWIDANLCKDNLCPDPIEWKKIELVCRNYANSGFDQMFAYDDNRNGGTTYYGHWNDGVVSTQ